MEHHLFSPRADSNWDAHFSSGSRNPDRYCRKPDHTGPGKLQGGKFAAKKLSVTCVFEQHESIVLAGELQGEKLVGTFQTEGREGTWEATRPGKTSAAVIRQFHAQS